MATSISHPFNLDFLNAFKNPDKITTRKYTFDNIQVQAEGFKSLDMKKDIYHSFLCIQGVVFIEFLWQS